MRRVAAPSTEPHPQERENKFLTALSQHSACAHSNESLRSGKDFISQQKPREQPGDRLRMRAHSEARGTAAWGRTPDVK
jgi:hypothetical protein